MSFLNSSSNRNVNQPVQDLLPVVLNVSPYSSQAQKETCRKLVQELTLEEQELAACTSYAYWVRSTSKPCSGCCPSQEDRMEMAMREARRHLVGEDDNFASALKCLKETCKFRKERHIDVFRTCFDEIKEQASTSQSDAAKLYRMHLSDELLSKQAMVVCGKDQEGRAIILKMSRRCKTSKTTAEVFIAAQLYMVERAMACTEYLSGGKQEKVVAVFDFSSYVTGHAPPFGTMKSVAIMLQRHYPERLKKLLILDPPLWMKSLFLMMQPFLSADTKQKLRMISGEAQKKQALDPLMSNNRDMLCIIANGSLESDIDIERFLCTVPFHCLYTDKKSIHKKMATDNESR